MPHTVVVEVERINLLERIRRKSLAADLTARVGDDYRRLVRELQELHAEYFERFQKGRA